MNIVAIVQARVGSTRLPGKVLKKVMGRELLALQMERVLRANFPDKVVVATTILPEDNRIVAVCERYGFDYFRGHPTDLLDRHFKTGQEFSADVIIKIPSDCPLVDPEIIDKVIEYYIENSDSFDYVSNLHPPTFPDGNDVEIMPMETLHNAWRHAEEAYELEHTHPTFGNIPKYSESATLKWKVV